MADTLADDERRVAVRSALQALTERQREAVTLAFLDELTHVEVARTLEIPLGTTKTRIRSGLSRLRAELTTAGLTGS
jgi:RNA polymerase sigma-70 factor (ECF subfamily)